MFDSYNSSLHLQMLEDSSKDKILNPCLDAAKDVLKSYYNLKLTSGSFFNAVENIDNLITELKEKRDKGNSFFTTRRNLELECTIQVESETIRLENIRNYGFSLVNETHLQAVLDYSGNIIEFGSGTGYLACLLSDYGKLKGIKTNIHCYDAFLPSKGKNSFKFEKEYYPIIDNSDKSFSDILKGFDINNYCLMLVWPTLNDRFAYDVLKAYYDLGGSKFIYIAMPECCADKQFNKYLQSRFELTDELLTINYPMINEYILFYERS